MEYLRQAVPLLNPLDDVIPPGVATVCNQLMLIRGIGTSYPVPLNKSE